jgi:hypothetical protein
LNNSQATREFLVGTADEDEGNEIQALRGEITHNAQTEEKNWIRCTQHTHGVFRGASRAQAKGKSKLQQKTVCMFWFIHDVTTGPTVHHAHGSNRQTYKQASIPAFVKFKKLLFSCYVYTYTL